MAALRNALDDDYTILSVSSCLVLSAKDDSKLGCLSSDAFQLRDVKRDFFPYFEGDKQWTNFYGIFYHNVCLFDV